MSRNVSFKTIANRMDKYGLIGPTSWWAAFPIPTSFRKPKGFVVFIVRTGTPDGTDGAT